MSNSKMIGKAIAGGLCVFGILASFNAAQGPASAAAPTIAEATAPAASNLDKQLLGQWQGTVPSGQSFTFVFAPEGKLFLMAKGPDGAARAKEMRLISVQNRCTWMSGSAAQKLFRLFLS